MVFVFQRRSACHSRSHGGVIDGLLIWVGVAALIVIAALMYASYWVGNMSLRDTHWTHAMVNLGALLATELRARGTSVTSAEDRRIWEALATDQNRAALFSDQRLVTAVIRLTGRKDSLGERERLLRCTDALLARAVRRQKEAVKGVGYSKALARKWRKELQVREAEIASTSWRLFARRWFLHTMTVVGVISGIAVFVGSVVGLVSWLLSGYMSLAADQAPSADWSTPTSYWATVGTVIAVAIALAWQVVPAITALFPWSKRFLRRGLIVAAGALALAALVTTWDFLRFDPSEWLDENQAAARPYTLVIVAGTLILAAFLTFRPSKKRRLSRSRQLVVLGLCVTLLPVLFARLLESLGISPLMEVLHNASRPLVAIGLLVLGPAFMLYLHDLERRWYALQQTGRRFARGWFRVWHIWLWLYGSALLIGWLSLASWLVGLNASLAVLAPIVQLASGLATFVIGLSFCTGLFFAAYFLAQIHSHGLQQPTIPSPPESEDPREFRPARLDHARRITSPLGREYERQVSAMLDRISEGLPKRGEDQAPGM